MWLSQGVPDPALPGEAVEQKLKDQWIPLWHSNVRKESVCGNYSTFKCTFGGEEDLGKLETKSGITLTKIRTNNRLPVRVQADSRKINIGNVKERENEVDEKGVEEVRREKEGR